MRPEITLSSPTKALTLHQPHHHPRPHRPVNISIAYRSSALRVESTRVYVIANSLLCAIITRCLPRFNLTRRISTTQRANHHQVPPLPGHQPSVITREIHRSTRSLSLSVLSLIYSTHASCVFLVVNICELWNYIYIDFETWT